jgi:hypothetical protein
VVVVDDAHLLDDASAEAIPFIARRLRIDGIARIIATESDDGSSSPLNPTTACPKPKSSGSGRSTRRTPERCWR